MATEELEASTSAPPLVQPSPYSKPIFLVANGNSPTRDKLVTYTTVIGNYVTGMRYTLHFLNDPPNNWPTEISLMVRTTIRAAATIWRAVAIFGEYTGKWETHIASVCLTTACTEMASARAASSQPATIAPQSSHVPCLPNMTAIRVTLLAHLQQHVRTTGLWSQEFSPTITNMSGGFYNRWKGKQGYGQPGRCREWRQKWMSIINPQKNYTKWPTSGCFL